MITDDERVVVVEYRDALSRAIDEVQRRRPPELAAGDGVAIVAALSVRMVSVYMQIHGLPWDGAVAERLAHAALDTMATVLDEMR